MSSVELRRGVGKPPTDVENLVREEPKVVDFRRQLAARRLDIMGISTYFGVNVFGFAVGEMLLLPFDTICERVLHNVLRLTFVCFQVGYLSVVCVGPGMPSKQGASQLPQALASCLEAVSSCATRDVSCRDGWCEECSSWKPVLSNHCKVCGRCCFWMDHHCNFVGQCVGFRNLRCFFVWLSYGFASVAVLCIMTLVQWVRHGLPNEWKGWLMLGVWLVYLVQQFQILCTFFLDNSRKLSTGWITGVLMLKVQSLYEDAQHVKADLDRVSKSKQIDDDQDWGAARKVMHDRRSAAVCALELNRAMHNVKFTNGKTRGLFHKEERLQAFEFAFGSPVSWRWLIPGCPGGSGDGLVVPSSAVNESSCEVWIQLAHAIVSSREALARCQGGGG